MCITMFLVEEILSKSIYVLNGIEKTTLYFTTPVSNTTRDQKDKIINRLIFTVTY